MSSKDQKPDARARILRAATQLLAAGGRDAVTTRAVSAAAGVQPPTIYRHFGDMQGLFEAVVRETLAIYARDKASRPLTNDPVEELRRSWDLHIAFGLAHPDAYALLYSAPSAAAYRPVIREGMALLHGLVARVAEAGRLRVDVAHATNLINAAGTGVILALAATPPEERDPQLCESMREAIFAVIRVPVSAQTAKGRADAVPASEQVAVHAIALGALLTEALSVLSPAERQLLSDWLDRLATAKNQT